MLSSLFGFGPFRLDVASGELRRHGKALRLAPQPFRVLSLLVANAGQVVTHDELRREVWGEETFVDFEAGLHYCLHRIREVLDDRQRAPRYIETLPRRGYRFIAPVERRLSPADRRLSVLPFDNLNKTSDLEYFADGMTELLITELGRLHGLHVISRQSVRQFKGSENSLAEIARRLGVGYLIEGTVLHAAGDVRITAQLLQAGPEEHLWAQSYQCKSSDVLALQRDVVSAIAREVQARLAPDAGGRVAGSLTTVPAAHTAYLQGCFHANQWTAAGFRKGMDLLSQAIALDPCYAAAYARLASTLAQLGFWGHVPMAEAYPRAKELARKAIALDEALSEAHDSLAWATWLHDWDLDTCEREIDRAIALNPSNENGAIMRATFRAVIHRDCAGAQEEARRALEIGPLSLLANACVAWVYLFTRDWAKASEQATATLDMFPESLQARYVLGLARLGEGRLGEAVAELRTAAGLSDDSMSLGYLAHVSARAGDSGTARGILAQLLDRHRSAPVATRSIVMTCAALGELDTAFEWLERAYAERDGQLFFVPNVLVFDPLRADPRFARLIARVRRAARTASRPPPRRASR